MPKKQMKFKDGSKVKRYAGPYGSYVSRDSDSEESSELTGRALPPIDEMESINANVRRALAGERPPAPEYTEMPSPKAKDNKFVKAVEKVQKSQSSDPRMLETMMSRGSRSGISQIPSQSMTAEQREGINKGERVTGTELSRNLSNTAAALTPLGGGVGKIGAELALGGRGAKTAQTASNVRRTEEGFSPAEALAARAAQAKSVKATATPKTPRNTTGRTKSEVADKEPYLPKTPKTPKAKKQAGYQYEGEVAFPPMYKEGGAIKKFAKGGSVSSASSRADGCAVRGKTKGMISKMKSGGMYGGKGAC
jgi:hypothetical protein